MRPLVTIGYTLALLAFACGKATKDDPAAARIPAFLASAPCAQHTEAAGCAADTTHRCTWVALGPSCPEGARCPAGACAQLDGCAQRASPASCAEDPACAWSGARQLCPLGSDCAAGGYCHAKGEDGSGCACLSPLACPTGASCPVMECDCSGGGGGGTGSGGSCTCACAPCEPGSACPPCACDCTSGSGSSGCVEGGTCACACPTCPAGAACAPCQCDCIPAGEVVSTLPAPRDGGEAPAMAPASSTVPTCACPACAAEDPSTCPPCSCSAPPPVCAAHADAESCAADTANRCRWDWTGLCPPPPPGDGTGSSDAGFPSCPFGVCGQAPVDACSGFPDAASCEADSHCIWYAFGIPCMEGMTCRSGVCQERPAIDPGGCFCACPAIACLAGQPCPPCTCSCDDAVGGCAPPPPPEALDAGSAPVAPAR